MTDDIRLFVSCRVHHADRVPDQIDQGKWSQVGVIVRGPTGCVAVAPLIGSDHVIAEFCDGKQDVSPAVGEFGKPVKQEDTGSVGGAGLQEVDVQSIPVVDVS